MFHTSRLNRTSSFIASRPIHLPCMHSQKTLLPRIDSQIIHGGTSFVHRSPSSEEGTSYLDPGALAEILNQTLRTYSQGMYLTTWVTRLPNIPCTVNLIHVPSLQRIPILTSHEIHPSGATRITPTALAGYIDDVKTYTSWTSPQSVIALHSNFITILCILTVLGLSVDFTKCVHALHKTTQWHFPPISPRPRRWRRCEPLWNHEVAGITFEMKWTDAYSWTQSCSSLKQPPSDQPVYHTQPEYPSADRCPTNIRYIVPYLPIYVTLDTFYYLLFDFIQGSEFCGAKSRYYSDTMNED